MRIAALGFVAVALVACTRGKGQDGAPSTGTGGAATTGGGTATTGGGTATAGGGSAATVTASGAIVIRDVAGARAAVGKRVRIDGTTDNAKLGGMVVAGDLLVYCADRKFGWDERNTPVVVEGVLSLKDTVARTGPSGEVSAGTGEATFELDTCAVVGGAGKTP